MVREQDREMVVGLKQAILELGAIELGKYLDNVYLRLNRDFVDYESYIITACMELDNEVTDEEREIVDEKLFIAMSEVGRPKTFLEMTDDEFFSK